VVTQPQRPPTCMPFPAPAPTQSSPLSLHDALPIFERRVVEEIRRERITLAPGGRALVQTMKAFGAHTVLVSGGFTPFAEYFAKRDRKSTRLNSSHVKISYAVFCLKKKTYPSQTAAG